VHWYPNRRSGLATILQLVLLAALAVVSPSTAVEGTEADLPRQIEISPSRLRATESTNAAFDCSEVGGLDYLLKQRTVLLLGEIHGTVESPQFVADLLCNAVAFGHSVAVALQLPEFESEVISQYLDSEGTVEDRKELLTHAQELTLYQDGRFSDAMLGLLDSIHALRALGGQVDLRLFVPSDIDSRDRQALSGAEYPMAVTIWEAIEELDSDLFIVLAGLTPSRVIRGTPLDPDHEPMGYILSQWNPTWRLLSLALSHSGGTAWVCTSSHAVDCRALPLEGGGWGTPNSIYIYGDVAETGYDGLYFVGEISHSPPARADAMEPDFEIKPITELPLLSTPQP